MSSQESLPVERGRPAVGWWSWEYGEDGLRALSAAEERAAQRERAP